MNVIALLSSVAAVAFALSFSSEAAAQSPGRASAAPAPAAAARAQVTKTSDYTSQDLNGEQVVKFSGDELSGPSNGAYGTVIRQLPGAARLGLIRPRLNFVPELLKTVENL